jgi:hypothetical protein
VTTSVTNSWKSIKPITIRNYDLSDLSDKSKKKFCQHFTYSELNETTFPLPPLDENSATNAVLMPYALRVTSNP